MSSVRMYADLQHARANVNLPSYVLVLITANQVRDSSRNIERVQYQKHKGVHYHAE